MIHIAKSTPEERNALFLNTASQKGIHEAIVEKDFWVCYILDFLFHRSQWKKHLAFKGGTSLSKAYGLIERFSEDIDVILDWRVLGYGKDEPWEERSNTRQDKFNKQANARTEEFLEQFFVPTVQAQLSEELCTKVDIHVRETDRQTVVFAYPRSFENVSILSEIRLEIGALAAWTPVESRTVMSYAAEQYPDIFEHTGSDILTVLPTRTFWEKATILHREAYRPEHLEFPRRYSRHYYDLYYLAKQGVLEDALKDKELLKKVAAFKDKFYHCAWAEYGEARRGNIRLTPPEYNMDRLREDYALMSSMIFGEHPEFKQLIEEIRSIEEYLRERLR